MCVASRVAPRGTYIVRGIFYCRMSTFSFDSMVRGHYVYKDVWNAVQGDVLECARGTNNRHDPYAVAVLKDDNIVGHLPRKISASCALFIRRSGVITCTVNGSRRHSADLPHRDDWKFHVSLHSLEMTMSS